MIVAELFAKLGLNSDEASFSRGEKLIENLHHALEFAIGYEAVKGVTEMVMSVVELGSKLNDTAQKTGIAVQALQFYGYVAKLNSSDTETFSHGLVKLSKGLEEVASKGEGPAADALRKLGIGFGEFNKLKIEDKVELVAKKFAKMEDGQKKIAIAIGLFGKSGEDLIPTLNDLGKNGEELHAQFEEMGGGLSKEQTEALDQFGDDVDKVKMQLGMLKGQIVADLLPALQDMLHGFMEWIGQHKELIESSLKLVVEALIVAFKAFAAVMEIVVTIVDFFNEHTELMQDLIIGLGIVIGAFAAEAAVAWVIAFGPVLLAIAAITALVFVIRKLWDELKNSAVARFAFDLIKRGFEEVWSTVQSVGDRIRQFFAEDIPNAIQNGWDNFVEWITNKLEQFVSQVRNTPVIKQVLDLAGVGATLDYGLDKYHELKAEAENPTIAAGAGAAGNSSVSVGDTTIIVNPSQGMDEKQIGDAAADAAKQHVDEQVKQALDRIKGGVR